MALHKLCKPAILSNKLIISTILDNLSLIQHEDTVTVPYGAETVGDYYPCMHSLNHSTLESNKRFKINFDGGDLSSDSGLLLIKEFTNKLGFDKLLRKFDIDGKNAGRTHTDGVNLLQVLFQIFAAYFEDDCADELTNDPIMTSILAKEALASQPTLSRFYNRMDNETLSQLQALMSEMRKVVYAVKRPERILLDLDSTLLDTYGHQEGEGFNFHYSAHGYHPLVCYDGLTGDLLGIQLRDGTTYSSNGVADFMRPILEELTACIYPPALYLRGDSGFATPELYEICEEANYNVKYAIRLKYNKTLHESALAAEKLLFEMTADNAIDYAVVYGEFYYQAGSWSSPRRVVFKIEKPYNQINHMYTFIVTNMTLPIEDVIRFYCGRGKMENYIKESKNGFDFGAVSSQKKIVNANRLLIHALAYNIFNWFKRLALPSSMKKLCADTIRLKLIKIASKVVKTGRYIYFKLCSSCPYKREFYETLSNIGRLIPQIE